MHNNLFYLHASFINYIILFSNVICIRILILLAFINLDLFIKKGVKLPFIKTVNKTTPVALKITVLLGLFIERVNINAKVRQIGPLCPPKPNNIL